MRVTKAYTLGMVCVMVEDNGRTFSLELDNERQMKMLGQCLIDLERTGGHQVTIEPYTDK